MSKSSAVSQPSPESISRRASWCALVVGLAVVVTAINAFPPAEVHYRVSSDVVVSSSRIPQLTDALKRDRDHAATKGLKYVQLLNVEVLDQATDIVSSEAGDEAAGELALVKVDSLWTGAYSGAANENWLKSLAKFENHEVAATEVAKKHRFANWSKKTAESYLKRHDFLADKPRLSTSTDGKTFELATGNRTQAQLASFGRPIPDGESSETADTKAPFVRADLEQRVAEKQTAAAETAKQWRKSLAAAHGLVRIANQPSLETSLTGIPTWIVFSVLVTGVCVGLSTRWTYLRLQSGGVYQPETVAVQLALQGLPTLAKLEVVDPAGQGNGWSDRTARSANQFGKQLARNMTRIGEAMLAFWVVLIAYRLVLDPLWRDVLYESPLVALARILSGMP
ncbi:MAG: hypothetical protein ACE361_01870 [Aureliella sp.]